MNRELDLFIAFLAGGTFTALFLLGLLHLSGGI